MQFVFFCVLFVAAGAAADSKCAKRAMLLGRVVYNTFCVPLLTLISGIPEILFNQCQNSDFEFALTLSDPVTVGELISVFFYYVLRK